MIQIRMKMMTMITMQMNNDKLKKNLYVIADPLILAKDRPAPIRLH
jgi:hypothetical protein